MQLERVKDAHDNRSSGGVKRYLEKNEKRAGKSPKRGKDDHQLLECRLVILLADLFQPSAVGSSKPGLNRRTPKSSLLKKKAVVVCQVPVTDVTPVITKAKEAGQPMPPVSP